MARKTKYTPECVQKICTALEQGHARRVAYALAGISHECFSDWLNSKPEFSERIKSAEAVAEAEMIKTVLKAANGFRNTRVKRTKNADGTIREETSVEDQFTWQAAAWWLERRRPDDYAISHRVKLEVEDEVRALLDFIRSSVTPGAWREVEIALVSPGEKLGSNYGGASIN